MTVLIKFLTSYLVITNAITICCTALSVWNVFKDRRASELSNLRSFPKASAKVMLFFDLPNFFRTFFEKFSKLVF